VKEKAELVSGKKTQILPPIEAVEIAWGRTVEVSSNESARSSAENSKRLMENKIKRAASTSTDQKEQQYVESASSAIEAAYRNLVTARNSLDLNFREAKALGQTEKEKFEHFEKFSSDLQSLVPKVAEMTIGGITGGVLIGAIFENWFPESMKTYTMPLVLAFFASLTLFIHQLVVVPVVKVKTQQQVLRSEYDEIQYYKQYVARVRNTLKSLYERVERAHEDYFGERYWEASSSEQVVDNVLIGLEQGMCKNVAACIMKERVTPKQWSTCETGNHADKCIHWSKVD
jgi:hypothetical protein